ncbi:MAG: hypothetical protein JWP11_411 [Frankiales bacterium]|nr:hypothetical protein [Frankiales bacterium]
MQVPGAWVLGHSASVLGREPGFHAACPCGYTSMTFARIDPACLSLTLHLQSAVRAGAPVMGEGDGLAGVREPRRPLPPHDHLSAARDIA